MAITRIKNSSIANRTPKYNDVLAGLPFRPVIGTATDGGTGTTVSVAFTGNNPAGAGITYTALSSPGSITATGPASPITVTGLTAGTAYTFQVKAGNSLGDSAYSGSSNSVTPVTPTAFESIATATASGVSSITFSSIPGTYQHLQIRALTKSSDTSAVDYWRYEIEFNTTAMTYSHRLEGDGAAASANSNTIGYIGFAPSNDSTITNTFGVNIIDIHDYASTTKNKTVRSFCGQDVNGTKGRVALSSAFLNSTTAITSITIKMSNAGINFVSGTTFALYGVKGA